MRCHDLVRGLQRMVVQQDDRWLSELCGSSAGGEDEEGR